MGRRVAVIGAGVSGLTCTKICVEEGLEPVCFESSDDIGGLWRFKESPEPERANIYYSLVTNTSKEMMCLSDFPIPADFPNYMPHSQLLQYFRLYAEHFDLLRYIKFQTTVRSVGQRADFSVSGQWDVVTINRDGEEERQVFDAVLVCSGHNTHPTSPQSRLPGFGTFAGRCFHSWEFKDAHSLRGKRVVVVGFGNSAGDIAVEISRSAEKTFLSTRQGGWVIGRMSNNGLPLDMVHISRCTNFLKQIVPETLINWATERKLNDRYDHTLYCLKPKHRIFEGTILINDDLPGRILQGAIVLKSDLKGFAGTGVLFEDGTVEDHIDAVIFCTGYKGTFPFLPPALSGGAGEELTLYKRMFPPSLPQPTLAFMGFLHVQGPIMPTVEMQARWAAKVFSGSSRLPSQEKMLEVIECDSKLFLKGSVGPNQAALTADYIPYVDFMAKEVGVRPNLLTLLLRDPVLWAKVLFGPFTPYQFRLTGPGQWAGARRAILTQWERVAQPFKTRALPEPEMGMSVLGLRRLLTFGGSVIMFTLLSQTLVTALPGAAQILEICKDFLGETWLME